jgi:hypothetical protein
LSNKQAANQQDFIKGHGQFFWGKIALNIYWLGIYVTFLPDFFLFNEMKTT